MTPDEPKEWDGLGGLWDEPVIEEADQDPDENMEVKSQPRRRKVEVLARETRTVYRRAFSETQLLDVVGMDPLKEGYSYHFITAGDVDSLSYLKIILRHQDLDYCLFSTWCMAADDILQIEEWLQTGKLKKVDAYVGEIFPGIYRFEYKKLKEVFDKYECGRIAVFRNHAKIYAGTGPLFSFGIETSANINTNPRTENGCITIGQDIFEFYKNYFDGIISFVK